MYSLIVRRDASQPIGYLDEDALSVMGNAQLRTIVDGTLANPRKHGLEVSVLGVL
jgi:hypothetical protein